MSKLYFVGEPVFVGTRKEGFCAPAGQVSHCLETLRQFRHEHQVLEQLRQEYLSIVWSLKDMGIDFRIIFSHPDSVDKDVLSTCIRAFGCKLVGFPPEFFPPTVLYPRDLTTMLSGLLLLNDHGAEPCVEKKDGYRFVASPYGEGGRILFSGDTALICQRLVLDGGTVEEPYAHLQPLHEAGMKTGLLPCPAARTFSRSGKKCERFYNDHLDRVACLLRGADGSLNLLVDPKIVTVQWHAGNIPWSERSPQDSLDIIRKICRSLNIRVLCPESLQVPYSLNMIQFDDGRVLMTGGDEPVYRTVSDIMGRENVFRTPEPITLFPGWMYAGIRCLVNEAPLPMLKTIGPS